MQWLGAFTLLTIGLVSAQENLRPEPALILEPTKDDSHGDTEYEGTFWVTCANKVRPGHDLVCGVRILKGEDPVAVTLSLNNGYGNETLEYIVADVTPGGSKLISLPIPATVQPPYKHRKYGQYVVRVVGTGANWTFKAEGKANYVRMSFTTFIQTDKAMYKPGQTMKVRCLAVNPNLSSIRNEPWLIEVKDPQDNLVWQRRDLVNNQTGVIEVQIPLADRTATGDWKIITTVLGLTEEKPVTVDYYVLPRFEVEVTTKHPFGTIRDKNVEITVQSKYTFGKPVIGGLFALTISPQYYRCKYYYHSCDEYFAQIGDPQDHFYVVSGELDDKGMAVLNVSADDLLSMDHFLNYPVRSLNYRTYNLHAAVTEPDTLRMAESETSYQFYQVPIKATTLGITPTVYKPGLRWTGYFEVQRADGSRISKSDAAKLSMKFSARYSVTRMIRVPVTDEEKTPPAVSLPDREPAVDTANSGPAGEDLPTTTVAVPPAAGQGDNGNNADSGATGDASSSSSSGSSGGGNGELMFNPGPPASGNGGSATGSDPGPTGAPPTGTTTTGSPPKTKPTGGPTTTGSPPKTKPTGGPTTTGSPPKTKPTGGPTTETTTGKPIRWVNRYVTTTTDIPLDPDVFNVTEEGWVVVSFDTMDVGDVDYIEVRGSVVGYGRFAEVYEYLRPAFSANDSFLQMQVPADRVKVGDVLNVVVRATEDIESFTYQVYAKGSLVKTDTIHQDPPSDHITFDVELTQIMAPVVKLVVFYVRDENKEFVNDAVTINVDNLFARPVSLEFDPPIVEPGDDVTLKIMQDVGNEPATAYILANDKSVRLLKSGNDLNQDMVRQAQLAFDYGYYYPWMRFIFICGWPSFFGGRDAYNVFQEAGILVLTDGYVYKEHHGSWRYPMDETLGGNGGFVPSVPESDRGDQNLADDETSNQKMAEDAANQIRNFFPETWLWDTVEIPAGSTEVSLNVKAPDTITAWLANTFTMHPTLGLTVPESMAELITTKPLSVQLDLPLSVTRHEQFCFTASVFNQENQHLNEMTLTLDGSDDFELLYLVETSSGQDYSVEATNGSYSYVWGMVAANDIKSYMFCIRPTKVGEIPVTVRVKSEQPALHDAIQKDISVKAEGLPRSLSYSHLVTAGGDPVERDVSFLTSYVSGSQHITVNIVGNILGSLLEGIDKLLRKPYGCGEQNMLNFAPNVFLLDFFIRFDMLTEERLEKGLNYMSIGYQKALGYEHNKTGGYSTFGNSSSTTQNASLWLTDFILKCFSQAELLTVKGHAIFPVDLAVLERSVSFIGAQQKEEGYFVEHGKVFNKAMQGGTASASAKNVALTAYTVIALSETREVFLRKAADTSLDEKERNHYAEVATKIDSMISKADSFLKSQLDGLKDPFDICITGYALNLIDSSLKDEAFAMIENSAVVKGNTMYWPREHDPSAPRNPWSRTSEAIDVESTSYALLTYLLRNEGDYLDIVNYLSEQRGPNGGFYYTQDTVIGLQALTSLPDGFFEFSGLPYIATVSYFYQGQTVQEDELPITEGTLSVIRSSYFEFVPDVAAADEVKVSVSTATGQEEGKIFTEIILDFNVLQQTNVPFFDTSYDVKHTYFENEVYLIIRIRAQDEPASMTLLTVDIPSGYEVEMGHLLAQKNVSYAEIRGDVLVAYFDTDVIGTKYDVITAIHMTNDGFALPEALPKYYTISLYYSPDTEVSVEYDLAPTDEGFCEVVKYYNQCPFFYLV